MTLGVASVVSSFWGTIVGVFLGIAILKAMFGGSSRRETTGGF